MMRPSTRRSRKEPINSRSRSGCSSQLPAKTSTPRSRAASSIARWSADENGFDTSSSTRPIVWVFPPSRRSIDAFASRRYLSCSIARLTLASSAGLTPGSALTTRETVFKPTPASAATSSMVGRRTAVGAFSDNEVSSRPVKCRRCYSQEGALDNVLLTTLSSLASNDERPVCPSDRDRPIDLAEPQRQLLASPRRHPLGGGK